MEPSGPRRLRQRLLDWFDAEQRALPWRRTRDPYRIWVSEVMLQQTRVATAIPYYRRFLRRFPSLRRLAAADLSSVLKAWEGLGYYARARNLHRAARLVLREHGGRLPRRFEEFARLPGAGEYLAAAVTSIAFGEPQAAVDGNARRVLARWLALRSPPEREPGRSAIRSWARRLLHPDRPGDSNQALMELGALVCTPRSPACERCPWSGDCRARQAGCPEAFPPRRPRREHPVRQAAAAMLERRGRLLLVRRAEQGLLGGLWELPGGFVDAGETPAAACRRHLRERLDLRVETGAPAARVAHDFTHFRMILWVFRCREIGVRARLVDGPDRRWVRPQDIDSLACHRAVHRALERAGYRKPAVTATRA
jgi:A/G-specific adenine glycosylase